VGAGPVGVDARRPVGFDDRTGCRRSGSSRAHAHGQIATLIAPADTSWDDDGTVGAPLAVVPAGQVAPHVIRQIAEVLRRGEPAVMILGGSPIRATMIADAQRIASATGAQLTHRAVQRAGRARPWAAIQFRGCPTASTRRWR